MGKQKCKNIVAEYLRTDLACESGDLYSKISQESIPLSAFVNATLTRHQSRDKNINCITIDFGKITERSDDELRALSRIIAKELEKSAHTATNMQKCGDLRLLAVGLGNAAMTADAIGPGVLSRISATRHLKEYDKDMFRAIGCCEISAVAPGVLGQTGIESAEIIKAVVERIRPHLILAIDALAARNCERLASTVQLSNGGIAPGSGIGNTRFAIDRESMGCPVIVLGVPTVVDSSTLVYDALRRADISEEEVSGKLHKVLENGKSFIVSPRDSDRICELVCTLLSRAIDQAFGIGE